MVRRGLKPIVAFQPVGIHAIPVCIAGLLRLFAEPHTVIVVGGIVATATYAFLLWLESRDNEVFLTPVNCFLFWFGLVLGPTSIYFGLRFAEDDAVPFLISFVPFATVATGYVLTLLGACCLHLGLACALQNRKSETSRQPVEYSSVPGYAVLISALVTLVFSRYIVELRFLGSTLGYLLADIGPAAACLYASSKRSGVREEWTKLLVLIPATILLSLAKGGRGSKLGLMSGLIPLLWFLLSERRRRVILFGLSPLIAAGYILFVTPAVTGARLAVGTDYVTAADIVAASHQQMDAFARDPESFVWQWCDGSAERLFAEPVAVGYIVTRVESEGFTRGATLEYLIWAAVPRIFWKDKPFVSRGGWFTSNIGASLSEESAGTSTGMTSPGELFWNFGWFGVIAGMWLLGYAIAKLLWGLSLPDPRANLFTMLPYVHILINFMLFQDSEAGSSALNILQAFLLFFLLQRFMRSVGWRQPSQSFALQYSR